MKTADVQYREDLYPRFKPNPGVIQEYAANLDMLPPIEVSQQNILIDGYHRWKAYQTAGLEEIPAIVTTVNSEMHLLQLAVERNSKHGQQLTREEKRKYAVRWWDVLPVDEICRTLSISDRVFREWTSDKRKQKDEETRQQIYDLWLSCHTQEAIGEMVGIDRTIVGDRIAEFVENGDSVDSHIFRNFSPELYSVWNFAKATNEARVFGSIPPEIIDNLLYYYTKPFDVVFDPFGGGGSTIDKCVERKRRYYVSDLNPIPARADIRQYDITTGFPNDLPVPDLIFLDPPYWKQAAGKYSDDQTDLGNVTLEAFLETLATIAKTAKRKWNGNHQGRLALIVGPCKHAGVYTDLAFLGYEATAKYLTPLHRIVVPYSTQQCSAPDVASAKRDKRILSLFRDLMIFGV